MTEYLKHMPEGMVPNKHGQFCRAESLSLARAQRDTAEQQLVIKQQKTPKNGTQSLVTPKAVRAMQRHDNGPFHPSLGYWDGYNEALLKVAQLLEQTVYA